MDFTTSLLFSNNNSGSLLSDGNDSGGLLSDNSLEYTSLLSASNGDGYMDAFGDIDMFGTFDMSRVNSIFVSYEDSAETVGSVAYSSEGVETVGSVACGGFDSGFGGGFDSGCGSGFSSIS